MEKDSQLEFIENSEEVQEIITSVPSWIVRAGTTTVAISAVMFIVLCAFIKYPDTIETQLVVNSLNSPKSIKTKIAGKLTKILVKENAKVRKGDALGYIESTADPVDVIHINEKLRILQSLIISNKPLKRYEITAPTNLNLGEIQNSYEDFYQSYLQFLETLNNGYYDHKRAILEQGLTQIQNLRDQIIIQREVQSKASKNVEQEYQAYKQLYDNKVLTKIEFKKEENNYYASKAPIQQSSSALLINKSNYEDKEKEILELNNSIQEQKSKFTESLNSYLEVIRDWMSKYVLTASTSGLVTYSGIIQESQNLNMNQEVFIINPGNTDFFGEIAIPQYNMGKIKLGQRTLIKLRSYPFEEYGYLIGKVSYVSDVAVNDSVFFARVSFNAVIDQPLTNKQIHLKNGMVADAEIITRENTLLQRFYRSIIKMTDISN